MKRLLFVFALAVALMAGGSAQAAVIIDFGGTSSIGGTITYSGGVWTGTDVPVPNMNFINTPANQGIHATDAVLNFKYGGGFNQVEVKTPGGFADAGIAAGQLFLWGTFSGFSVGGNSTIKGIEGSGPDTKNPLLLAYAGLPEDTPFSLYGFTIGMAPAQTAGNVWIPFSSDISNTAVPEPGSMLLLGTGLFGLAGAVRRRLKK